MTTFKNIQLIVHKYGFVFTTGRLMVAGAWSPRQKLLRTVCQLSRDGRSQTEISSTPTLLSCQSPPLHHQGEHWDLPSPTPAQPSIQLLRIGTETFNSTPVKTSRLERTVILRVAIRRRLEGTFVSRSEEIVCELFIHQLEIEDWLVYDGWSAAD